MSARKAHAGATWKAHAEADAGERGRTHGIAGAASQWVRVSGRARVRAWSRARGRQVCGEFDADRHSDEQMLIKRKKI